MAATMSWARYDDEFPMNKKVGRLIAHGRDGIAAIGLHLLCNTYARHNGTGGLIDAHVPNLLVGSSGRRLAVLLAEVGMFDPSDDGWVIHDYSEFHDPNDPNPDQSASARKKELSEKRREAGRQGGLAKAGKGSSKPVAVLQQTPSPDPVPDPKVVTYENNTHHPHGVVDDDGRYSIVLEALVDARIAKWPCRSGSHFAHRTKVRSSIIAEHHDTIVSTLQARPDHPAASIIGLLTLEIA